MTAIPSCSGPAATRSCAEAAIDALRRGGFAVVADDPARGGEADLTLAAEHVTAAKVNFMVTHRGGIIYLCLPEGRCRALGLRPMRPGGDPRRWESALTVSIEARDGVSTGISAHDRARTIGVAANPEACAEDLVRPGHVFPVGARPGGVLERAGRTEASVDLARMAGLRAATVDCELLTATGAAATGPELEAFCAQHELPLVTVADVVARRS